MGFSSKSSNPRVVLETSTQVELRERRRWGRGEHEAREELEEGKGLLGALSAMVKNGLVLPVGLVPVWLLY